MQRREKLGLSPWFTVRPYVAGAASALVAGLLGNDLYSHITALKTRLKGKPADPFAWVDLVWLLSLAMALAYLLRWWHSFGRKLMRARTRQYRRRLASQDQREHLVLFLSNLSPDNADSNGRPLEFELTDDFDNDLAKLLQKARPYWPWEQMLRAIRVHRPQLQAIYCIGSPESLPQAMNFRRILEHYDLLKHCRFELVVKAEGGHRLLSSYTSRETPDPAGIDFEDFDDLAEAVRWLIAELRGRKIDDRSVMVDFTGGLKVTSVVAVAETFDLEISAQYVQTSGNKNVYSYDVVVELQTADVPVK